MSSDSIKKTRPQLFMCDPGGGSLSQRHSMEEEEEEEEEEEQEEEGVPPHGITTNSLSWRHHTRSLMASS